MKLNENFVLKTIAGSTVVMPVGDQVEKVHGMIKLNPTAKVIWEALEQGKDKSGIEEALKNNFQNIDESVLSEDVDYFLNKLKELEILVD